MLRRRTAWLSIGIALAALIVSGCTEGVKAGAGRGRSTGGAQVLTIPDGGNPAPDGFSACVAIEDCTNGLDDNCDGLTDCADRACVGDEFCGSACVPEVCGNSQDDDCDGRVDCGDEDCVGSEACRPACPETTQDCGWPGCNHHDGSNEAACLAEGNLRGCPDYVFTEWCRRRTPAGRWDAIHTEWVAARCTGEITLEENTFVCREASTCTTYRCTTPLVIVLDGVTPVTFSAYDGTSAFDLSSAADGSAVRTDWPTASTPWLVLDRDGNGLIDSGRELFGSATLVDGVAAHDGFEALDALDANADDALDARDPAFGELTAWADANGDRVSQPSELRTIASLGVVSLSTHYRVVPYCDTRGNCERERGSLTWLDAGGARHTGALIDVHLRVR